MENYTDSRRDFLRKFATSPTIPYVKNRATLSLKLVTLSAVKDELQSCGESVAADFEENEPVEVIPDRKRHICVKNVHGLEDKERRRSKLN